MTPYSRLDIAYTELRPYEESGTNAALAFGEQKLNLTKVNVGLLADYQWFTWIGKLRPYGRLEYSGDLSNSTRPTASYINERSVVYETKLHDFRANSWHLGLGIDFDFYLGWFTASYERTEEAEDNNNHQIDRKSDTIRLKMLIRS